MDQCSLDLCIRADCTADQVGVVVFHEYVKAVMLLRAYSKIIVCNLCGDLTTVSTCDTAVVIVTTTTRYGVPLSGTVRSLAPKMCWNCSKIACFSEQTTVAMTGVIISIRFNLVHVYLQQPGFFGVPNSVPSHNIHTVFP